MPNLKEFRDRQKSVKSIQKITSAMGMVAGAKLRKSQHHLESARPYAHAMARMLGDLSKNPDALDILPSLLVGRPQEKNHLLIIMTSDRGLCGAFNTSLVKAAKRKMEELQRGGKSVKFICVGRKGRDLLKREFGSLILKDFINVGHPTLEFQDAEAIAAVVFEAYEKEEIDACTILFNKFRSPLIQEITFQSLIPLKLPDMDTSLPAPTENALWTYEPSETKVLNALLPFNLAVQIYQDLLESAASEQGARMIAMQSSTRNAEEMLRKLELTYNRVRQALITKELIEIISGAEAL